jgi:4-hydroxy-L-threonine phosphate dehydrogenase PdxA
LLVSKKFESEIAGQGIADASSMKAALLFAAEVV